LNCQIPKFHAPAVQIYFFEKIQVNIINLKNIPKSHTTVPNYNKCFKVVYKTHRKNLKTKIKNITLPSVGLGTQQYSEFFSFYLSKVMFFSFYFARLGTQQYNHRRRANAAER
jgi:hypothetical protein